MVHTFKLHVRDMKMSFNFKLYGFNELENELKRIENTIKIEQSKLLVEMALMTQTLVKKRTPVLTGDLRRSWRFLPVTRKGNTITTFLYSNLDYATSVEFGRTSKSGKFLRGKYMLTSSLVLLEAEYPKLAGMMYRKIFTRFKRR